MKLYSEEDVKEMLNKINALLPSDDKESLLKYAVEHITEYMTPIELPNDEEIEKEAFQVPYNNTDKFYDESFIKGAKWMKEQILNQNKQI